MLILLSELKGMTLMIYLNINPLWLEFSFTLEYFFKCRFWVANISNVGKNIKKVEVYLTVQILGFCRKMLSLPNSSRI